MSEEVKSVHREPHPFVGSAHMAHFVGKPVAFVGRVEQVSENSLLMHQHDRKYPRRWAPLLHRGLSRARSPFADPLAHYLIANQVLLRLCLGREVKIIRYRNEIGLSPGDVVEVRGIVNKDQTISFGEFTQYDRDFDLGSYESMLDYYHGMCKQLCMR